MVARLICLCVAGLSSLSLLGQDLASGQRNGLIQATASLYPSVMLNRDVRNNSIGGHLAYYFEDQYSFRGDAMMHIGAQSDTKYVSKQLQITAGFGRHFPIKRFDPFIYANIGLAAAKVLSSAMKFQPVVGLTAGVHYNVSRYFYFFGECIYSHLQDPARTGNLDQLYVSGGLGFQFPTKK